MQYSVVFAVDGFALKEACLSTNAHELTENTQLYLLPPLECHVIDYGSEEEGCVSVCVYVCVCLSLCVSLCVCDFYERAHPHHFNTLPLVVPFV